MSFGGMHPYPRSFGGKAELLPAIVDSIAAGRGTGVTSEPGTIAYVENLAIARAIYGTYRTNQRLANIWRPMQCPWELIPRWETIMGLPYDPALSEIDRRKRVLAQFTLFGRRPDYGLLYEVAQRAVGAAFTQFDRIAKEKAVQTVPDGSYPWGTVIAGSWTSTTFRVLLRVQKPTGMTEGEFYEAMGELTAAIDLVLPAWLTFDWYRPPVVATPIFVLGGPSAGGFFLDEPNNLDNAVFDV